MHYCHQNVLSTYFSCSALFLANTKKEITGENNWSNCVSNVVKPLEKIHGQVSNTTIYTNRLINKRIS